MAVERISNETLSKTLVVVAKNLEKTLKDHESKQEKNQEEIQSIVANAVLTLRAESEKINSFSIDLRPLDDKMKSYVEEIDNSAKKLKKAVNTPVLDMKVLGVFAFVLITFATFFYFSNEQSKELKKTQNAMNYYIDFIKSDKKRMEEFEEWRK